MLLRHSHTSPFVRKVAVPLHQTGLAGQVALGSLHLRGAVGEWRQGRPPLAAWFGEFAGRSSMIATAPPA